MLGVRLSTDTEKDLAAFARRTRRSKSNITRDAVREYIDRHTLDAEFRRQLGVIATATKTDDLALLDQHVDDRSRNEPDYDWGSGRP